MSDFEGKLKEAHQMEPLNLDPNHSIACLLWADDILLLSKSRAGLQKQLQFLEDFSDNNILEVNIDKTKAMCFNKKGELYYCGLTYKGELLEVVNEYSYLGFLTKSNGNVEPGIKNLQERATKAFFRIKNSLPGSLFQYPLISFHIFDKIIKPIALYASDFWGLHKENVGMTPIANRIHLRFCKWLLGVSKRTSNTGVQIETARYPISLDGSMRCLENLGRIARKECNPLLIISERSQSIPRYITFFNGNNLSYLNEKLQVFRPKSNTSISLKKYLIFKFFNYIWNTFLYNTSKLEVQKLVKTEWYISPYILDTNTSFRSKIAKLRLSDHNLEIEKGRFSKTIRSRRICKCCCKGVEDIGHFILACRSFKTGRIELFSLMSKIYMDFSKYTVNQQITILLNPNKETRICIAIFLSKCYKLREGILEDLQI